MSEITLLDARRAFHQRAVQIRKELRARLNNPADLSETQREGCCEMLETLGEITQLVEHEQERLELAVVIKLTERLGRLGDLLSAPHRFC
jgi:hypothetical protein